MNEELQKWDVDFPIPVLNGYAFYSNGKSLVINPSGHILILNDKVFNQILSGKISYGLQRKLKSRGFFSESDEVEEMEFRPEFFMIDLTNRCNLRCKYCFRNVEAIDMSILQNVVDDICDYITNYCDTYNLRDISVQAWGGEPLLEQNLLFRIRHRIRPKKTKVHFSIETNGTLLSKRVVDDLYNNRIGVGVSIDGREVDHDAQRVYMNGDGSFQQVSSGILRTMDKYGSAIGTITTITRNNFQTIECILDYYAKELKLKNLKFNFVHRSTFVENDELCLSTEEIIETETRIFDKLVSLVNEGYEIFDLNIRTKIENILHREYSDACLSRGCCGGKKMIVFGMEGDIYPCELTDYNDKQLGTIYEDKDLILLLNKSKETVDFFGKKSKEQCEKCPWHFFCRGGCTVRMLSCGKQTPEIDEIECAVNVALYPKIVNLILKDVDLAYKIIEM